MKVTAASDLGEKSADAAFYHQRSVVLIFFENTALNQC